MADLTAPWDPRAAAEITQPVRHVIEVYANHTSWPARVRLDVEAGTVEFSEERAPHVQAQVTLRVPPTQAVLDSLDPRLGVELQIDAGYVYPGGVRDVHRLATLRLWERTTTRPGNLVTLSARSGEARLIEWMPLGASTSFTAAHDAGASIAALIGWALPGATVVNELPPAPFVTGADTLAIGTGDNLMSALFDIADRAGNGWVYEDGNGTWRIGRRPEVAGQSAAILKVGVNGTLTASDASLSLDDWYNAVLVEHSWYDTEPHTVHGWAEVTSGPLSVAAVGRRALKVVRDYTGSTATARVSAAALVQRTVSRGRGLRIQVGAAPYWVRPGSTVTVQLPTGSQERHLVTSIQFDLRASGTANIATRLPELVTITTGE